MKKQSKSQKLADRIAQLETEMKAARVAEHEAAERELISLVNRAGCLDGALRFARNALAEKHAARQSVDTTAATSQAGEVA